MEKCTNNKIIKVKNRANLLVVSKTGTTFVSANLGRLKMAEKMTTGMMYIQTLFQGLVPWMALWYSIGLVMAR